MILNKCLKFLLLITFVITIIAVLSTWSLTNINNDNNVYQPTVHCDVSSRIADDRLYCGGHWLSTVHISIKSTENYPISRLPVLGMTWLQTVPPKNKVFIVTDKKDKATMELADQGYNVYYSSCPTDKWHGRETLSCKCGDEFNLYYEQVEAGRNYSWYCHFDDDVYVNSPELQKLLSSLDHEDIYYLGIRSMETNYPVEKNFDTKLIPTVKRTNYAFAGGHAYCMSKKLMNEMERYARGKVFVAISINQSKPDDVTVGFIVEAVLGYNLTEIYEFNSHRTPNLHLLTIEELPKQITISYKGRKHINLPNSNMTMDPTRFLSYHCLLYPYVSWCVSHRLPNLI